MKLPKLAPLLLVLALHLVLLINSRFTLWPEIISSPYLLNNGFSLFTDFIHPYPPLLPLVTALLFRSFGYSVLLIQAVTWILILLTDIFIYKTAQNLSISKKYIYFGLVVYALVQTFLEGNMLWYDTALTLPYVVLMWGTLAKKWKVAIASLVIMCLIKQTAIFTVVIFLGYLIINKRYDVLRYTIGALTVVGFGIAVLLSVSGQLSDAYKWIFYYPSTFWVNFPGYVDLVLSRHEIMSLIFLSAPGIFLLIQKKHMLVALLYLAAVVGVYPRFSFFHMQPAIALSSLSMILMISHVRKYAVLLGVLIVFASFYMIRLFIPWEWRAETRFFTSEDHTLYQTVRQVVQPNSVVFFLNVPSQLYVLTETLPPKPWLDNYGWYFEVPGVQAQLIDRWRSNPPDHIIWKEKQQGQWYDLGTYEPALLTEWIKQYYERQYEIVDDIWMWEPL